MIDYCISAFYEDMRKIQVENYICDSLMNINSILANRYGGSYITVKLPEHPGMNRKKKKRLPEISESEVRERIKNKVNSFTKGGTENGFNDPGSEADS